MANLAYVSFLPIACSDPRILRYVIDYHLEQIFVLASIFPFCAILGYLTPKLIDELSAGNPEIAGRSYAINTIGSILGPLFAGYILLPVIGARFSLILMAVPFLGYFLYYIRSLWRRDHQYTIVAGLISFMLFAGSLGFFLSYEDSVFYHSAEVRRDYAATVISAGEGMKKNLIVNGIIMTQLTPVTKYMAHIPLAIRDKRPESILIICLGMGTTFRSAASWDIRTTAIELVPSVRDAFGFYFRDAETILRRPGARIIIDDGRRFLIRSPEMFDVITIDPPPPVEASGSGFLYSEEFYRILKNRLNKGGILQQWLPGGLTLTETVTVTAAAKSITAVFPYVKVFHSIEGWGYHFFASMEPINMPSVEKFVFRLPANGSADLIEWHPGKSAGEMYQKFLKNELILEEIVNANATPSITDDRPLNEYFLVRKILKKL